MSFDPSADLAVFFNLDEFATLVVFWPGEDRECTVPGIFSESDQEGRLGEALVGGVRPVLLCPADQVAQAGQRTPLRIDPNPRLGISGGNYLVAARQPGGSGKTLLQLQVRR